MGYRKLLRKLKKSLRDNTTNQNPYLRLEQLEQRLLLDGAITVNDSDNDLILEHDPSYPGDPLRLKLSGSGYSTYAFLVDDDVSIDLGGGEDSLVIKSIDMGSFDLEVTNAESITVESGATVTVDDLNLRATAGPESILNSWVDDTLGLDLGLEFDEVVLSSADAIVNVTGATINASNVTLSAVSDLDVDTDGFSLSSITTAVIVGLSNAEVVVDNSVINVSGDFTVQTDTIIDAFAKAESESGSSSTVDAAIAVNVLMTESLAHISGNTALNVSGTIIVDAGRNVTGLALADGSAGGSGAAGATLAFSYLGGDVEAFIDDTVSTTSAAGAIEVLADSTANVRSQAISTRGGAEESGGDSSNDSETEQQLASNDAETSDGDVAIAAALAITDFNSLTQAYISSTGAIEAGDVTVRATSSEMGSAWADGTATDGDPGVGVAVAINYVDIDTKAWLGDVDITAGTITVEARKDERSYEFDPTGSGIVDSSAETINLGENHGLRTGDVITYNAGGGNTAIGGLEDGTKYYVIYDDANPDLIKLAESADNAEAGTAIDIDGTAATGTNHGFGRKDYMEAVSTSGAGGEDVGVAGSLAINIINTNILATIEAGSTLDVNGADIALTADSKTRSRGKALPDEGASGESLGLGASVVTHLVTNNTKASIGTGVSLAGADDVTLNATGNHSIDTEAKGGAEASGGIAITPVVAVLVANNNTTAIVESGVGALTLTGNLHLNADHTSVVDTVAEGDAEGEDAAIGASLALNSMEDIALATSNRSITAGGNLRFITDADTKTVTHAKASAQGAQTESEREGDASQPDNVDQEAGNQRTAAEGRSTQEGGGEGSSSSTPSAESSDGAVVVAAAISINVADAKATASIADGVTITAGDDFRLITTANNDNIAIADGSATNSEIGIGAAVAINSGDVVSESVIGAATVNAEGIIVDVLETNATHNFHPTNDVVDTENNETIELGEGHGLKTGDAVIYRAGDGNKAIGGLKDGEVYYVIYDKDNPEKIKLAKTIAEANGNEAIDLDKSKATGTQHSFEVVDVYIAEATAGAGATDVGIAGAFSLNKVNVKTEASIRAGANVSADGSDAGTSGQNVIVRAVSSTVSIATANSKVPGSADVGVGASVALNTPKNTITIAEIQDGASLFNGGSVEVTAEADHIIRTKAVAGAAGDVSVSPSVAITISANTTTARVGTSGTTLNTQGKVEIRADHSSNVITTADAEAAGSDVGIGAAVGVAVSDEIVSATLHRNVTTSSGDVSILSSSNNDSYMEILASAKGNSSGGNDADTEADHQANDNSNTSGQSLPSSSDETSSASNSASDESSSGSGGVGIAAAVGVNVYRANNSAYIANGVTVSSAEDIEVIASGNTDAYVKAIGKALDSENDTNIAAAVSVNKIVANNTAYVGNSTLTGRDVLVKAEMVSGEQNAYKSWAMAGSNGSDNGISGSVSIIIADTTTRAYIADGADIETTRHMSVVASVNVGIQNIAGAAALSEGNSIGAAVALNVIDNETVAYIGNADVDVDNDLLIKAETLVTPLSVDIPIIGSIDLTSAAAAAGASSGDVGIAGSATINLFDHVTQAYIATGAAVNQSLSSTSQTITISAIDNTKINSSAGAVGISTDGAGVGAGLDLGIIDKDTRAYIAASSAVASGGAITISSDSDEDILSISANLGIGDSAGVAGSASVQVIRTKSQAYLQDGTIGNVAAVSAAGNLSITADGDLKIKLIAGAVGIGGTAGVGASNTTLVHTDEVKAWIGDRAIVEAGGLNGILIKADSSEDIISIGAAGGLAGDVAVAGTAVVTILDETTIARVGRLANVTVTSPWYYPDMKIDAYDNTKIVSVAGSLAAAGTAAVGLGADVGVIGKVTKAYVDSGVIADVKGDIEVRSNSNEDITSVAAGVSVSGSVSVGLDASVHTMNLTTRAFIGDEDGIGSAGPGNVHAMGSIVVDSNDRSELDKVVGVLAIGGYVGVGAAGGVTVSNKTTDAFIGKGAIVQADGVNGYFTVNTGGINIGNANEIAFDPNDAGDQGIEANNSSVTSDNSSTLSNGGEVKKPQLASMNVDSSGGNDVNDSSFTYQRTANLATMGGFRGLSVTATNRDDIEAFTMSVGGGTVGVAVSATVNVVTANTKAYISDDAVINSANSGEHANQSVNVGAGSDFYNLSVAGTLGVGVVGVSPAADVNIINGTTQAFIGADVELEAENDVYIQSHASEDLVLIGFGIAGGVVGVGGAVNILTIDNESTAMIGSGASVLAGGDVLVNASDNTDMDAIAGALAGGFVGVGASVGVVSIDKDTNAFIASNADVTALGNGTGLGSMLSGTINSGGTGFGTTTVNGLVVQAKSVEDIFHLSVAGGAGFVGVSGAVTVTLLDSDTDAYIDASAEINQIGSNAGSNANQSVYVNAANDFNITSFAGGVAGGFVGIGGAVEVGSVKNDVGAYIRNGAIVTARNDVEVNALSIKELNAYTFSGAGGLVGLSASVSVWSLGEAIDKTYSDDDGGIANAVQGEGGASAEEEAADKSAATNTEVIGALGSYDKDESNPNNSSTKYVGSATQDASDSLNAVAPTSASIQANINSVPVNTVGTVAAIESGAVIYAGDDINVNANEYVELNFLVGSGSGGLVGIGAAVSVVNVASSVVAHADGVLDAGDDINITAKLDEEVDVMVIAGSVGFVALGAAVVDMEDSSSVHAYLGDGATVRNADTITIHADGDQDIDGDTGQVAAGAVGAGASFIRLTSNLAIESYVGNNVHIASGAGQSVENLTILADGNIVINAHTVGIAAGIGAFSFNFAYVDVNHSVEALIGNNSDIHVNNEVNVYSDFVIDGDAVGIGTSFGGIAVGGMYADVSLGKGNGVYEVVAGVGTNTTIEANVLRLKANSEDDILAQSKAGGGGVLAGIAGAFTSMDNDNAAVARIGDGSEVDVTVIYLTSEHNNIFDASSDAFSFGLAAGSGAAIDSVNTTKSNIIIGSNVDVNAKTIVLNTINDFKKEQFANSNNLNSGSAGLGVIGLLLSKTQIGDGSNKFESVITIGSGSNIIAEGTNASPGIFNR